jgi:hypothetical protein
VFRGSLWVSVLEASLNDRLDFQRRLKARPMMHATAVEIDRHETALKSAKRQIDEIVADLAKARGET